MQTLSSRWAVSFGAFTLNAALSADDLDRALVGSASSLTIPANPQGEVRIAAACAMFDPSAACVPLRFLDNRGNTWVGVGTRQVANTPNPALVEAAFRRRAEEAFGPEWNTVKKKRLTGLRRVVKNDLAAATPFRLSETGALFICVQTGEIVAVGTAAQAVAKDLPGRIQALSTATFPGPDKALSSALMSVLRRQEESVVPWPSGSASLFRKRGESSETASVRLMSWAANSTDAADLVHQNWRPAKIELLWGDGRKGMLGLTGELCSVGWVGPIVAPDPSGSVETRLGWLVDMNTQVRSLVALGQPVPLLPVE